MDPLRLDRTAVDRFLDAAAAGLSGEWLLVGDAAAATWFDAARITEDIDLIGLRGDRDERLQLMDLAEANGLPIEAVNSAAGYFLQRIEGWREELEPLRTGAAAIHRPTPTLFLLLRLGRLSQADLSDCLGLLAHVKQHGGRLDAARVRDALAALPVAADAATAGRRKELGRALDAIGR